MEEAKIREDNKAEAFAQNPDNFVDVRDCLLIIQKNAENKYAVMNNCKSVEEVFMADGFARESCQNRRDQIRVIQMQKQQSGIVLPNGRHA